jgi:hypothetical protein
VKRRFQRQEPGVSRGRGEGWRPRAALAAVLAVCVAVTGVAVAGAGNATPGIKFAKSGQWVFNSTLGTIFHVNGSTKDVDSPVQLPGAGPGTRIVESDKSGYALAQGRIYEFGKSDLQVLDPRPAPSNEPAVGLSAGGAAFAVYQQAGSIVRMGDRPVVATPGVPLGPPVVTSSGTLWVHRSDNGQLCQLPLDSDRLSCPAKTLLGHQGALTLIGDNRVVFVDVTGRAMYAVDEDGLGRQVPLPLPQLPATAIIAQNDVAGRIAIVDPQENVLHLVDSTRLTSGEPDAAPIRTKLSKGKYERIASSGDSLALIDDSTDTLVTVDHHGIEKTKQQIPPPSKRAVLGKDDRSGLFRGDDSHLYVASRSGEQVMVVDDAGEVTSVATGKPEPESPKPVSKPTPRPVQPVQPVQPPIQPAEKPAAQQPRPSEPEKPQAPRTNKPTAEPSKRPSATKPSTEPTKPSTEPTKPSTKPVQPPPKADPKPPVKAGRPGAPRGVSGKAGTGSAQLSWGPAAPNGAPITSYRVSWNGGSRTLTASQRSTTVTGLTNGNGYTFTVRAVNSVGSGPGSNTARLVPDGGAADAPPNFTVKAGDGKVTVSWSRPDLHGNTFQGYQVAANTSGSSGGTSRSTTVQTTSHTFTGLDNGVPYRVTVQAITTDPQGRLVLGKLASRTVTLGGGDSGSAASLRASRGADTTHDGGEQSCNPPGCAFIRIVGKGLKPDTAYFFQPFTTEWQPSNPGATLTTESDGSILITDRFATDAPGQQVWVVATAPGEAPVTSNKFTWSSR